MNLHFLSGLLADPQIWIALITTVTAPLLLNLVSIRSIKKELKDLGWELRGLSLENLSHRARLAKLERKKKVAKR